MTPHFRFAAAGALAASLVFGFAACKKIEDGAKPGEKKEGDTTQAKTGDSDIAKSSGLKTTKEQASYMIGMEMGKSLQQIKDEIDFNTLTKALKTSIEGGKPLLTDAQAQQIAQTFGQEMQAKQLAKMEEQKKTNAAEGSKFLAENGKKQGVQTTASGLQYQVLTEGKGPKPTAADTVRVHYKGELLDGKVFDSSYDRGEPAIFPLNQVAPGWAEGVQLMPVGSKYKLWIPSKLGYGEQGTPGGPIPPNATLVFEVELLEIMKPGATPAPAPAAKK
ncbi:FKBP-type peptidyl-prolyl cis-trans isomerase [Luteimonas aquatica]|uniref:FKBP-type peptidyl-prolyl cis-trans isomerase n=1 Tax=Luteimonas aquatica TaxID=450364 RepID=UPI001F587A1A|nr:FKBP-type peptidyl-prolyl cis-trans isomerase [Luteimonas aquatica]